MRILHIVPTYIPAWRYGGTIHSVHGLCKSLAARGHDVHVFTTNVDGGESLDVETGRDVDRDGVKVRYFESRILKRLYWAPQMARELEKEVHSFDLVHLHSVFLWPTLAAARVSKRKQVPYLVAPRGMLVSELIRRKNYWVKTAWIRLIEKKTIERAQGIHATSVLESRELDKLGFRLPPVYVVPNGVDIPAADNGQTQESSIVQELTQKKPFILCLGRIHWKKGLDRLIKALPNVPDANLVIVGNDEEGYRSTLQKLANEAGVAPRITLSGPFYGTDKRALIKAASLLALPSLSENFGNVVLEAMAEGCPVLVSEGVGLADTVKTSGAGRVVGQDIKELAGALSDMLSNPEALRQMGEHGKLTALREFSWEVVAQKMEATYEKMLRSRVC